MTEINYIKIGIHAIASITFLYAMFGFNQPVDTIFQQQYLLLSQIKWFIVSAITELGALNYGK